MYFKNNQNRILLSAFSIVAIIAPMKLLPNIASASEISQNRDKSNDESNDVRHRISNKNRQQINQQILKGRLIRASILAQNESGKISDEIKNTVNQPEEIVIRQIKFTGNTVFSKDEINSKVKRFIGQSLIREKLVEIENIIVQLYIEKGYINSTAVLNPQITDGVVEIRVTEGSIAEIKISGTQRLKKSYIRQRIELGVGKPFNSTKLEDQLRLLKADPLLHNVEASLRATGEPGKTNLIVRVQEEKNAIANLSVDNYSPPSVGSERLGAGLHYRNLTGIGDKITGNYYRSTTGGSSVLNFNYSLPLNPMNGRLQLGATFNRTKVTQPPFDEFNIRGEKEQYEISYRQPLIRTPREEFALSLGFAFQEGQTFLFDDIGTSFGIGPDEDGVSRTSVVNFGQDYIKRDRKGNWVLRSQFTIGTGLFNATTNDAPIPDGHFFSWLAQARRVQLLGKNHVLIIQADLQLTPNSLLPAHQFTIGGGQSVRGYRQNVRSGDNGFRFLVEDRITLKRDEARDPTIQIAPFFNMGTVWNLPDNPNDLPNQRFLAGGGLGLLWKGFMGIKGANMRLDYAAPLVDLDDTGDNAQDSGFYFSINYQTP